MSLLWAVQLYLLAEIIGLESRKLASVVRQGAATAVEVGVLSITRPFKG